MRFQLISQLFVFCNLLTLSTSQQPTSSPQYFNVIRNTNVNDVIFTNNVTLDVRARSLLDCSRLCARKASCWSFSFELGGDSNPRCLGYSMGEGEMGERDVVTKIGVRNFVVHRPEKEGEII